MGRQLLRAIFFVALMLGVTARAAAQARSVKDIQAGGELRVLSVPPVYPPDVPRVNDSTQQEIAMLTNLAEHLKVTLKIIYLKQFDQLLPALEAGSGDLIAANLTVTPDRLRRIDFSRPILTVREHLIAAADNRVTDLSRLEGKTVWLQRGTCHWKNMEALRKKYPGIKVSYCQDEPEDLLYKVGAGIIDYAMVDGNVLDSYLTYRSDVRTVHTFDGLQQVAWGINRNAAGLKETVDRFLAQDFSVQRQNIYTGDLPGLRRLRVLRILTRNNAVCYYIHRGVPTGFEYELAKKFAESEKLIPVFIVPPSWNVMFAWLKEGRGDLIAANATITDYRNKLPGITFCAPYLDVREVVVTGRTQRQFNQREDLNGQTIAIRRNSPYHETVLKLIKSGIRLKLVLLPEDIETWEILSMVADGKYDLTIADDLIFNSKRELYPQLRSVFRLTTAKQCAWLVRQNTPELRKAVDNYFADIRKTRFFASLYQRCFKSSSSFKNFKSKFDRDGNTLISPYDALIRRAAAEFALPWCLIAAQIFQESRFQANITASDGGMGLMQLMPDTVREMKCANPFDPLDNILAGTGYLAKMRSRFPAPIAPKDQMCFALAAYNGGYGHVIDARQLARRLKLNPDVWLGNVEKTIDLLGTSRYAEHARYGFCRSDIIIRYVNQIMVRFVLYNQETSRNKRIGVAEK